MDKKEVIIAKLAEWGIKLSDSELDQLLPAYENLLRWQAVVEDMVRWQEVTGGVLKPLSEPALIHRLKEG